MEANKLPSHRHENNIGRLGAEYHVCIYLFIFEFHSHVQPIFFFLPKSSNSNNKTSGITCVKLSIPYFVTKTLINSWNHSRTYSFLEKNTTQKWEKIEKLVKVIDNQYFRPTRVDEFTKLGNKKQTNISLEQICAIHVWIIQKWIEIEFIDWDTFLLPGVVCWKIRKNMIWIFNIWIWDDFFCCCSIRMNSI